MYKPDKRRQDAIYKLYENLKNKDYETHISWDDIIKLSGDFSFKRSEIYSIVSKVNYMLMQYERKFMVTIMNFGKKIVKPEEHLYHAKKTAKKSVKIYKKAYAINASTNIDMLNEEQKKQVILHDNKFRTLEMFSGEMLRKSKPIKDDHIKTNGIFLAIKELFK